MGFNCGIVGLPNVGKSTIFNALTAAGAQAANYPFCTIEPNTGVVPVADPRLDELARVAHSAKIIPTSMEFVDIAGLVKGASKGEGLGNQFLGHIRSVDAIVHVVRCFDDENITHVDGSVDPRRDVEVIETELLLADLAAVEKRLDRATKAAKSGDAELKTEAQMLKVVHDCLSKGLPARTVLDEEGIIASFDLLTAKPQMFVANVAEGDAAKTQACASGYISTLFEVAKERDAEVVILSGLVESEIAQLGDEERAVFLEDLGLEKSGLERLALAGHRLLNLITFFTVGPKETRAWTVHSGATSVEAAGKIHTDFAKGFIRAEVIGYDDYIKSGGEQGAKERGVLRSEGKTYLVKDGDVVHFRFNV